ncbi:nicotinate-nicotinamide nucleotide adenylyltransferase [Vibrio proteolyticus]|uniref:nicotinate-nucleotide adenylyltransferase n=1 Tax=Vibrio proteolyticus NBRC 13287 TaxID=1219065 RepID=U3BPM5_VIBPR|nr:nicotinate-nicotinamide nucleotide adenylyltransferase [Vibrio proteolyticus]GAD68493.1 nicotinate-nucleotide adenylyltransferase [Vibrio proteolyticus NBRC 13287]
MTKIAVFGSAFNPPSLGHQSVIASLSHFDRVLLIPSISHAWGKEMLDYGARCELVDLFIEDMALDNVARSDIEDALHQPGESVTTYAVLSRLQESFPLSELTFVMGPDNLFNFAKFYKADEITQRWSVMSCPQKVAIRSTDIRDAITQARSVEHLTTPSVAEALREKRYYQ